MFNVDSWVYKSPFYVWSQWSAVYWVSMSTGFSSSGHIWLDFLRANSFGLALACILLFVCLLVGVVLFLLIHTGQYTDRLVI